MCYTIPGRVAGINGRCASIDYFGEKRNALVGCEKVKVGNYVYVQGGILVRKVGEKEALRILKIWKNEFFKLKKIDGALSKTAGDAKNRAFPILQKANLGKKLGSSDLLKLLGAKSKKEIDLILETANNWRQKENSNACCVHGIIEFSNHCKNNCLYCGIRKDAKIKRYRMRLNEIIGIAKHAVNKLGFKALVLQSGEDEWYDKKKLIHIVKGVKKLGVLIFLSIGERDKELYNCLHKTGAEGALLRFETSNKTLFKKLRPKTSFEKRIDLIKNLKKMGYLVATGFIAGLPGEKPGDIIKSIILAKELGTDIYSIGPLIPSPKTPLSKSKAPKKEDVLKIIALTRFMDKNSKILVTTALETLGKSAQKEGLMAGANSLMINVTPKKYKGLYAIYPNKERGKYCVVSTIKKTTKLLRQLGRAPIDLGL